MRKRVLGKTGLSVSELALGTWGLSGDAYGPVLDAEVDRVIDRALAHGITLYDTADVYGRGDMEKRLGKHLPADKTHVVTKIGTDLDASPARKRFDREYLRAAFDRSRERLKREVIDIVLLHNPTMLALGIDEAPAFMKELQAEGAIMGWGVSAGSAEVARAAVARGADVVEMAYNALLPRDLHEIAGEVTAQNVGILARSVLAHGLLTGFWTADREFYPGDHRSQRWTRDELRRRIGQLDALRPAVGGAVVSLRSAALRFVLSNQVVGAAVLGPRSVAQLDQLVREAGTAPPYLRDTTLVDLAEHLKSVGVVLG